MYTEYAKEADEVFTEDGVLLVVSEGFVLNFSDSQTCYGGAGHFDTIKK